MTHHDDRCRRRLVIVGREHAAPERTDSQRFEVVAGHVLGAERTRGALHFLSPHADAGAARLKRGQLLELGCLGFETFEQRKGEHPPAILRTALDAAVVAVADAIQGCRVGDREGLEHHGVDQRENRGRSADAQRESEDCCRGKDARSAELPQRVADSASQILHRRWLRRIQGPGSCLATGWRRRSSRTDGREARLWRASRGLRFTY